MLEPNKVTGAIVDIKKGETTFVEGTSGPRVSEDQMAQAAALHVQALADHYAEQGGIAYVDWKADPTGKTIKVRKITPR